MNFGGQNSTIHQIVLLLLVIALISCSSGGDNSGNVNGNTDTTQLWTWVSGSDSAFQNGTYGTQGTSQSTNTPGARLGAVSWIGNGDLWLFGGLGYDGSGTDSFLNDLWRWDGTSWTWISGSDVADQPGTYGSKGIVGSSNVPGARSGSVSWTDSSGNLWLFGGGYAYGNFNDLWRWDGVNWTWISGSDLVNQSGNYGTKGIADSANVPGARIGSVGWTDSNGDFWLFGGWGFDSTGTDGDLNDLWRWDGINWTWISGSDVVDQPGIYGTKGIAVNDNVPGSRGGSVGWTDSNGAFWLFGGYGFDSAGTKSDLNDLWHWDGINWIWISGSDSANQSGSYGAQGIANSTNVPGARHSSVSWTDSNGDLWLFGGYGYDSTGNNEFLNDLWRWDGINWTWVSGSKTARQDGIYGTKGTADKANAPGARSWSVSWTDSSGDLWLFGGMGCVNRGFCASLNDLWRFQP